MDGSTGMPQTPRGHPLFRTPRGHPPSRAEPRRGRQAGRHEFLHWPSGDPQL